MNKNHLVILLATLFFCLAPLSNGQIQILSVRFDTNCLTVGLLPDNNWLYQLETASSLTGIWERVAPLASVASGGTTLACAATNSVLFCRICGLDGAESTSNMLLQVQAALESYRQEYGIFPPTSRLDYTRLLNPPDYLGNIGITGLVYYLWYSTPRDIVGENPWTQLLTNVPLSEYGTTNLIYLAASAPILCTNMISTIRDPWGREIIYECSPPYVTNRLISKIYDGIRNTNDIIITTIGVYPEYSNEIKARDAALVGLQATCNAINTSLDGENGLMVYPPWDVLASSSGNELGGPTDLVSGSVKGHIPASLVALAESTSPQWRHITNMYGRVVAKNTYIVVNRSGLLDANFIGGSNRWAGHNLPHWFG